MIIVIDKEEESTFGVYPTTDAYREDLISRNFFENTRDIPSNHIAICHNPILNTYLTYAHDELNYLAGVDEYMGFYPDY